MKLNVDLTELHLNAAKMTGLDGYLTALRNSGFSYQEGLKRAKQYVSNNGGLIEQQSDGVTALSFGNDKVYCFQPYQDIDRFYFEN